MIDGRLRTNFANKLVRAMAKNDNTQANRMKKLFIQFASKRLQPFKLRYFKCLICCG